MPGEVWCMGHHTQYLARCGVHVTKHLAWWDIVYEAPNTMLGGVWCMGLQTQCQLKWDSVVHQLLMI